MAILSANKAAKEAGIAKKTLLEALTSGRLSATKNNKGHWQIDTSELFRVFPQETSSEQASKPNPTHQQKPDFSPENSVLQARLEVMEQRFKDAEATIEDLRGRLDSETEERRQLTRMLTHSQGQPAAQGGGFTLWPFRKKAVS